MQQRKLAQDKGQQRKLAQDKGQHLQRAHILNSSAIDLHLASQHLTCAPAPLFRCPQQVFETADFLVLVAISAAGDSRQADLGHLVRRNAISHAQVGAGQKDLGQTLFQAPKRRGRRGANEHSDLVCRPTTLAPRLTWQRWYIARTSWSTFTHGASSD